MYNSPDDAGNNNDGMCLDYGRLYNNKNRLFDAFYSQTVNSVQSKAYRENTNRNVSNQKQAYTAT